MEPKSNKPEKRAPHAADSLQSKHASWIVEWAMEKCAESIERCELELVRMTAPGLADGPIYTKYGKDTNASGAQLKTRNDRARELESRLSEYSLIFDMLSDMQRAARDLHNRQFAEALAEMFAARRAEGKQ